VLTRHDCDDVVVTWHACDDMAACGDVACL
jgi:hypothetical protein